MTVTIAGVSVAAARLPDLRIYLKKAAIAWSAIVSVQDAFTVAELNALGIGNTVTLGADGITWTGTVNRLETRTGYSLAEITAPVADSPGLNNYDAITNPAVTDDVTQGYAPGSLWFNIVANTLYMCEEATYNAAEWRAIYDPSILSGSVLADGTVALTANWNAGNYNISSATLQSSIATGTAPLIVASETMVDNLNADLLDGREASYFAVAGSTGDVVGPAGATADNFAIYNSTTGKIIKDGGAKLTDVPLLAGRSGGQTLIGGTGKSENLTLTSTSNGTLGKVTTASQFESTLANGTAPFIVASSTVVANLNASQLEGHAASYFAVAGGAGTGDVVGPAGATADSIAVYNSTTGKLIKDGGATIAQIPLLAGRSGGQTLIGGTGASDNLTLTSTSNGTLGKITTASQIESTLANGTAPIIVTSGTVCTNLNAAQVNGFADTAFAKLAGVSGGQTLIGGTGKSENLTLTSTSDGTLGKVTTASQLESTLANGTAPIIVTSGTVCTNLNAAQVNGFADTAFAKLAGVSGGQTLNGGTAASNNLTLSSTSDGTKGLILSDSQINSTVATGLSPIEVDSITVCSNLNSDLLDGSHAAAFVTHALSSAENDFLVGGTGGTANTFVKKTLAETKVILGVGTGSTMFWNTLPGSPAYASATTITLADAGGANNYASQFGRGTLIKWILDGHTSPTGDQFAMVTGAVYGADVVTLTIVGSVVGDPIGSVKYCIHPVKEEVFIVPGYLPIAAVADIGKSWYPTFDIYPIGAIIRYKTVITNGGTHAVWDMNDDGATFFGATDLTIVDNVLTSAWIPSVASMAHPPVAVAADSVVTLDYVSGSATTPGADAYITMVYMPTIWRYLA